jgi:SAM-dependent MidA family methyltransferase
MRQVRDEFRKLFRNGDLPFREFVAQALYHPELGYYSRATNPVGKTADYVTAPSLSPVFSFALGNLVREFVGRSEGAVCSIVDIGCGDGGLIEALAAQSREVGSDPASLLTDSEAAGEVEKWGLTPPLYFGVDRALSRVIPGGGRRVTYLRTIDDVPREGVHLILSNELYDAFPFARLVRRGERMHELWVTEREGLLDWSEREAPEEYQRYFAERGIRLEEGQFADVSLDWEAFHEKVVECFPRALVVAIDYGFPAAKLFHPRARRYGTAAAYAAHRVSRDLLASPGEQDLTAHVNFSDLERGGERAGAQTLYFDRLAKFLLTQRITEHPLFQPVHERAIDDIEEGLELIAAREEARRLVLPDGIGEEMRVLVQGKGVPAEGWSFQQPLFS